MCVLVWDSTTLAIVSMLHLDRARTSITGPRRPVTCGGTDQVRMNKEILQRKDETTDAAT